MKIVEGMHKENKTLKQYDDRSVVIHLKNNFFFMFYTYQYLHFLKFVVLRTRTYAS